MNLIPTVARLLTNAPNHLRKFWAKKVHSELSELPDMEPLDIEKKLTKFWVHDLNKYLEDNSKSIVLFIDTYEDLRENYSLHNWIKNELIPHTLSQKVLWVICGREALCWEETKSELIDWSEYLKQYQVEELDGKYCIEYLKKRGIEDKKIQKVIFEGSKRVPYYLQISGDTYENIKIYKKNSQTLKTSGTVIKI